MSDSYKIYASQDYVDNKGLPDGASANQQLVTDNEGVVKWEEKPFYSETIQHAEEVFLEETSFSGIQFSITGFTSEFVVGTTYKVTLNGKVYESEAYYCDGSTAIGNSSLIGSYGGDNNPFFIGATSSSNTLFIYTQIPADSYTISITYGGGYEEIIHTIDEKYLPTLLPPVTTSDVGKFLRVSSTGEWVAESISNAEEASF